MRRGDAVAHRHLGRLEQAAAQGGATDCRAWDTGEVNFVRQHAGQAGLWFDPRTLTLNPTTPHRVTDVDSLLNALRRAGCHGISVTEIVSEHPGAYMDLHRLMHEVPCKIIYTNSQIWLAAMFQMWN